MKRKLWVPQTLTAGFLLFVVSACDTQATVPRKTQVETKPEAAQMNKLSAQDASAPPAPAENVLKAKYKVEVGTTKGFLLKGTKICTGLAGINLRSDANSGFVLEPEELIVKCLGLQLNLSILLAGLMKPSQEPEKTSDTPEKVKQHITSEGGIVRTNKLLGGIWNPPRPLIVGPIVQDVSQFANINDEGTYQVQKENEPQKKSSGTIRIKVLETDAKLDKPIETNGEKLDTILHWAVETEGFQGMSKAGLFLFDKLEIWMNTRPLVMAKLNLESNPADLLGSGAIKGPLNQMLLGAVGFLIGKVHVEMVVDSWKAD